MVDPGPAGWNFGELPLVVLVVALLVVLGLFNRRLSARFGRVGRWLILTPVWVAGLRKPLTRISLEVSSEHWRDALALTARDRIQIATPPSHILGLLNIETALQTGVWMRLHRRFDIDRILQHIQTDRITVEMAVAPIAPWA